MKNVFIRILIGLFAITVLGYGGILVYLMAMENTLVFEPKHESAHLSAPPDSLHLKYQRVTIVSEDGIHLVGWIIFSNWDTATAPWLLYFHGMAENVSYSIPRYAIFSSLGLNVLSVDYRGFGESEGSPTEAGLYKDATACYNYLAMQKMVDPKRIIIYGFSLGTGVAVDLASRGIAAGALILEASYTSFPDVAQRFYPYVPLKLLMRNRFNSIEKIDRILIPKLFVHSSTDENIPYSQGRLLFEKAIFPKVFLEIHGEHDFAPMVSKDIYCTGLSDFLAVTTAHSVKPKAEWK